MNDKTAQFMFVLSIVIVISLVIFGMIVVYGLAIKYDFWPLEENLLPAAYAGGIKPLKTFSFDFLEMHVTQRSNFDDSEEFAGHIKVLAVDEYKKYHTWYPAQKANVTVTIYENNKNIVLKAKTGLDGTAYVGGLKLYNLTLNTFHSVEYKAEFRGKSIIYNTDFYMIEKYPGSHVAGTPYDRSYVGDPIKIKSGGNKIN